MNCKQANSILIEDFLSCMGHSPVRSKPSSKQLLYKSPFREEKTASFKVNQKLNTWYDFGIGIGGRLVDFVMQYRQCSLQDALRHIASFNPTLSNEEKEKISVPKQTTTNVEVYKAKSLENQALISYLQHRKINISIAKLYVKDIYYYVGEKHYFGIGFINDSGGYEIRNKYCKVAIGKKDISTIKGRSNKQLIIFEGFIDFLSSLTKKKTKSLAPDVIVLNSVSLIDKAITAINESDYTKIYTVFDNDKAGAGAFERLAESTSVPLAPLNHIYQDYKDLNDWLIKRQVPE